MTTRYFYFTIGPVQSFVAQARRTRDFWAGSFILSWLAAVAMRSVQKQNGKISFPKVKDNYLDWLEGKGQGEPPHQGTVPNRFKAEIKGPFDPKIIIANVNQAWHELAELIWQQDLEKSAGKAQREIWERQIAHFWEISWILTESQESNLLDRRKNWRDYFAPDEPGVKCMVMEGWQELSSISRPNKDELKAFWQPIYEKVGMDLREGEYLCAIAFVKRRFARYFAKLQVNLNDWTLKGWDLETGVPSVSYLATVHWLEKLIRNENVTDDQLRNLHEAARKMGTDYGEWHTDIHCIKEAYQYAKKIRKHSPNRLKALDGRVFFESTLQNDIAKTEKQIAQTEDQKEIGEKTAQKQSINDMLAALNALEIDDKPSPFYAILLMDGDSLGQHMSDTTKQAKISTALNDFTNQVPEIVKKNNGFLVYAGGDDVLAILPLEDALACATELRSVYLQAFKNTKGPNIPATISGAVEFAHIKMPLTKILRDSHSLLDKIAKEKCGRDAIAVRVWKPGGKAIEWAMPWKKSLEDNQLVIETLATQFREQNDDKNGFSSKFFYKIRERFELLNPPKNEQSILDLEQACTLLAADYVASGFKDEQINLTKAEKIVAQLLEQCRPVTRCLDEDNHELWLSSPYLNADGALLIRFLANKGVE